jgi:uncharacterized protein
MSETCEFSSLDEAKEILGLMMRHWNDIAGTLFKNEVYVPLLLEDENGTAHGNDWARGFMRGMHMRHEGWSELVNDEEHGGCLIPMMMLYHEHDEDPKMRPKPISPEKREEVIVHMAAGLLGAYRYFRAQRQVSSGGKRSEPRRNASKVGRNDPCPCGSGKKYKKCSGGRPAAEQAPNARRSEARRSFSSLSLPSGTTTDCQRPDSCPLLWRTSIP